MKKILSFVIAVLFVLSVSTIALAQTSKKPHPYPEPGTSSFPQPGEEGFGGENISKVSDLTRYFKSGQFLSSFSSSQFSGTQLSDEQFTQLKTKVVKAYDTAISNIQKKQQQIVGHVSLNDSVGTDIDTSDTQTDETLKKDINTFLASVIQTLQAHKSAAQSATTVSSLSSAVSQTSTYLNSASVSSQFDTLTARVVAQRILHMSMQIEKVSDFMVCIVPDLQTAGFSVAKHKQYITDASSLFQVDWNSTSPIQKDQVYRPWANGSKGAKEEMRLAVSTLQSSNCKGSDACIAQANKNLSNASIYLQDMYHVAYWGFDNLRIQVEDGSVSPESLMGLGQTLCRMPDSAASSVKAEGTSWGNLFENASNGFSSK